MQIRVAGFSRKTSLWEGEHGALNHSSFWAYGSELLWGFGKPVAAYVALIREEFKRNAPRSAKTISFWRPENCPNRLMIYNDLPARHQ